MACRAPQKRRGLIMPRRTSDPFHEETPGCYTRGSNGLGRIGNPVRWSIAGNSLIGPGSHARVAAISRNRPKSQSLRPFRSYLPDFARGPCYLAL